MAPKRLKEWHPVVAAAVLRARDRARLVLARRRHQRLKAQMLQIVRRLEARGDTLTYKRVSARLGIYFIVNPELFAFFRKLRGFPV
jgi:hypothetical protein